ncbi:MAG TPA: aryl-sulfate sulfotransferase [Candidatus Acidoferrum sp.]|nr:aryl-sulfate sulfotransferase [Candidatus Acidoferrum sp.]
MKLRPLALFAATLIPCCVLAAPTVFPTGTTLYDPAKTWNGYTVLSILDTPSVVVIDMNGRIVKEWSDYNVSAGGPARVLPGGIIIATAGANPPHQEALALVERDFDGKELWRFDHNLQIQNQDKQMVWSARTHHDWQRTDFPAGYYSPASTPKATGANTLLLTHTDTNNANITNVTLEDDRLIEIDPAGKILWQWKISDHIDELRFDAAAREAIRSGGGGARGTFDALHINSATYVGPNQWFDGGDKRFAPDNVIISSRQASFIAIVARDGKVVWQIGPDFTRSKEEKALGQIIGQHHAHLIPPGLPGAGNLMVFDNGGASGYGTPTSIAPNGQGIYARATSRVLEINPVTLELKWSYTNPNFYSTNISSAQRLPNGNTLITEGAPGRTFEVTADKQIVWEYMDPPSKFGRHSNAMYRAYRIPYQWLPQVKQPAEQAVHAPPAGEFVLKPE